jgi:hypothetical protein
MLDLLKRFDIDELKELSQALLPQPPPQTKAPARRP